MADVFVPELKITIIVAGGEVACFEWSRTDRHPQEWEVKAALREPNSRQAVRACLLACVAELSNGTWEHYIVETEGGNSEDDQLQLPWS